MKSDIQPSNLLTAVIALAASGRLPQPSCSASPARHTSSNIRYCNRGYCYTRREPEHHHGLDALDPSAKLLGGSKRSSPPHEMRSGVDFCTDAHGHVMDCKLYAILGMDRDELEAEFEALEATGRRIGAGERGESSKSEEQKSRETAKEEEEGFASTDAQDSGTIDVDDHDYDSPRVSGHVTWKDRPVRGWCYDNDTGYSFQCDLVQILDDGTVLIEDHRHGGVFAAQPKSGYTTRRKKSHLQEEVIKTPVVVSGSSGPLDTDPAEDFRTNVILNLEGI